MKQIVFASCNQKKAEEMQRMAPDNIKIVCLKDIPEATNLPQAEETGKTFLEKALLFCVFIYGCDRMWQRVCSRAWYSGGKGNRRSFRDVGG